MSHSLLDTSKLLAQFSCNFCLILIYWEERATWYLSTFINSFVGYCSLLTKKAFWNNTPHLMSSGPVFIYFHYLSVDRKNRQDGQNCVFIHGEKNSETPNLWRNWEEDLTIVCLLRKFFSCSMVKWLDGLKLLTISIILNILLLYCLHFPNGHWILRSLLFSSHFFFLKLNKKNFLLCIS